MLFRASLVKLSLYLLSSLLFWNSLLFFSMNGVLEFYDTMDSTCMSQAEHFMATDVEWDPTGRYVATSVSWWAHKVRRDSLAGNEIV